jgi:DNA-binding GntR family transcriptional regulator
LIKGQESNALTGTSVEDAAYHRLREEIATLVLRPGARLPLEGLAELYGVSMTPIRHALRRLEGDGLVVTVRHRGSYVAPLSVEELEEVQAIRVGLEGLLSYHGAAAMTVEAVEEMERARDRLERAFRDSDVDGYIASFWEFRDACYRRAARPRAMRTLRDLRLRVERYVRQLCRDPEALAHLRRGPDRLLEACRKRDPEAAEAATREALLWVLQEFKHKFDREAA